MQRLSRLGFATAKRRTREEIRQIVAEFATSGSKINALRKLTKETGCVTRRTQSLILGILTPNELTAVAETLALQPDVPRG
jgi:hypothetical protein